MPGTEIEAFIAELEDLINNSKSPLSGGGSKKIIEAETAYAIIDDMRNSLPKELKEARRVLRERDELIEQAKSQAQHTIEDAEAQANILMSEQEVVRLANNMAADIKRHAEEDARDTRYWAESVVDHAFQQVEAKLDEAIDQANHMLEQIKNCRIALSGSVDPDTPEQLPEGDDVR